MSYAVFLSNISGIPVNGTLPDHVVTIHSIAQCSERECCLRLLEIASSTMYTKFNSLARVSNPEDLSTYPVGTIAITRESPRIDIWYIDSRVVPGWFINGRTTVPVRIGYFEYQSNHEIDVSTPAVRRSPPIPTRSSNFGATISSIKNFDRSSLRSVARS